MLRNPYYQHNFENIKCGRMFKVSCDKTKIVWSATLTTAKLALPGVPDSALWERLSLTSLLL